MARKISLLATLVWVWASTLSAAEFDPKYSKLGQVYDAVVIWNDPPTASAVDYRKLQANPKQLEQVLDELSAVTLAAYNSWSEAEQLAFLLNAYNAFTLQKVLEGYPDIKSIKDLGSWFSPVWKDDFIPLLGDKVSLDHIEHELIRDGVFAEPRIHFALNCASCGCPGLREDPFVANQLDAQLEDQTERFLSDKNRNYVTGDKLFVSKIFDWFSEDFEQSQSSIVQFLEPYADSIIENLDMATADDFDTLDLSFTDYDWSLNDVGNCGTGAP